MKKLWLWILILVGILSLCLGTFLLGVFVLVGYETLPIFGSRVAIVPVTGEIVSGSSYSGILTGDHSGSDTIIRNLKRAEDNSAVKSILLKVNSPGGSVVASEAIYKEIKRINQKKKVVVWMDEEAASGGYYISCGAEKIVADPQTLTGSIGVIMTLPNMEGLNEKIGLKEVVIKSGKLKDIGSPNRPMTDEERQLLQGLVDQAYDQFVGVVSEARHLDPAALKAGIADGRVLSGLQAKQAGLVDQVGSYKDALRLAADLGGIKGEPKTVEYAGEETSVWDSFTQMFRGSNSKLSIDEILGLNRRYELLYLMYP